jgi:hypothetical protein
LVLLLFCLALSLPSAFAGWSKKPVFSWMQFYRWDRHFNSNGINSNRYSLSFVYSGGEGRPLFKVMPFFEMRRNFDTNLWERREVGVEFGKDIFPSLYLGESIQHAWRKEEVAAPNRYEKENSLEAETRLVLSRNFFSRNSFSLKGFIADEYTYVTDEGRSMRNEITAGMSALFGKYWEIGLNWRHIDRISYFDTDTFEVFAVLSF